MLKLTSILIACIFSFTTLQAQSYPQIRLKAGMNLMFPPAGHAFKSNPGTIGSLELGGEYNHPLKNGKGAWHVGFVFDNNQRTSSPNEKNLRPQNLLQAGFYFMSAPAKTLIYGGFEKFIKRNYSKPKANYFSVFGGIGVAFTTDKLSDWDFSLHQKFETRDGIVEGYTSTYSRPRFPVAPVAYGGLRYNITNRKGNEAVILEFSCSYDFIPYYRQTIDYTLNGVPHHDHLKNNGFSLHLNVLVPLYSFHKKRAILPVFNK